MGRRPKQDTPRYKMMKMAIAMRRARPRSIMRMESFSARILFDDFRIQTSVCLRFSVFPHEFCLHHTSEKIWKTAYWFVNFRNARLKASWPRSRGTTKNLWGFTTIPLGLLPRPIDFHILLTPCQCAPMKCRALVPMKWVFWCLFRVFIFEAYMLEDVYISIQILFFGHLFVQSNA